MMYKTYRGSSAGRKAGLCDDTIARHGSGDDSTRPNTANGALLHRERKDADSHDGNTYQPQACARTGMEEARRVLLPAIFPLLFSLHVSSRILTVLQEAAKPVSAKSDRRWCCADGSSCYT